MPYALYPLPLLCVTVALLIRAELQDRKRQIYVFKPLSTVLVIVMASLALLSPEPNLIYVVGTLVGLLLSFGGDVALMFAERRGAFVLGLALFLLAHVAYTVTFTLVAGWRAANLYPAPVLLALGVAFYRLIAPGLGKMRGPVIVYMVVISVMVNQAVAAVASPAFPAPAAWMVAVGAVLFFVSDVILAANKFWKPWPYHRYSLLFYYGGQALIALAASYG